jgi:hypothetical protein
MKPLLVVLGVTAVVAGIVNYFGTLRDRRLRRQRHGYTGHQFEEYFAAKGFPRDIARSVYDFFERWMSGIPVVPQDDFARVLQIGEEDLDEALEELARRCASYRIPNGARLPPLRTMEDLVTWLSQLRAHPGGPEGSPDKSRMAGSGT